MASNLREKYAQERAKRLHPLAESQYVNLQTESFEDLMKDPYVDYSHLQNQPQPLHHEDSVRFLIIGGGHNGLLFAYRLIEAGFSTQDICIVDSAGGYGGTWYWNRYPGVMCDVEASIYLPLLEETGYIPKHRYAFGYDIRENAEHIARLLCLRAMFCTKVHSQIWDEARGVWHVSMKQHRGPGHDLDELTVSASFVFGACGYFYSPKLPNVPGFDLFRSQRHTFHTARWDYAFTGGSQERPALVKLKNKTVGIVGTGATGIQVIPELAKWSKHLYVFQRTASHCFPRAREATDLKRWHGHVADGVGWQYGRQRNFERFISNDPDAGSDIVNDGWTANQAYAGSVGSRRYASLGPDEDFIQSMLGIDDKHAEASRTFVDLKVRDPATAEKLKAWYPGWCKRPTFHDNYLDVFNQRNVTLVDTSGKGIEAYTSSGVIANGFEYEVDVLIFATGFSTSSQTSPAKRMDGLIIGRGGRSIDDKWKSNDFGTYFGLMSHQFPNMFFYAAAGVPSSPNLTPYYDSLARLAAHILAATRREVGHSRKFIIEASKEAEDNYTDQVEERSRWYSILDGCTPGYYNREAGRILNQQMPLQTKLAKRASSWGGGPIEYHSIIEAYMKQSNLRGILLSISREMDSRQYNL